MSKHELLNNQDHKALTINLDMSNEMGNNTMHALAFPFEFKELQAHYPIFFRKEASSDNYSAVALLGFEKGENLFIKNNNWQVSYIPAVIERDPFLIGYQQTEESGALIKKPVIHIDMSSPRVNKGEGQPVFLPHGGNSEYLNSVSDVLNDIEGNSKSTKVFFDMLKQYALLEPFNLDIELNDGNLNRLSGYYTINQENLYALDSEIVGELNRSGFLMLIYMTIASLANISKLVSLKNA